MHFASFRFLGFFVAVFAGYWLLRPHRARMIWLLTASAVFYMSWNPLLIALIMISASIDYLAALAMERWTEPRARRAFLIGSVSVNLGILITFKYADFFVSSAHSLGNWVGIDFQQPIFQFVLPLGISFYTFEAISYVVDVYRGKIRAERNLLNYALFILFFPHLIAGPIVRPGHFLPQIQRTKRWSWERTQIGVQLFMLGMLKKTVIADNLAAVIDPIYADPASYGTFAAWLATLTYPIQLYGDFSGYSDMAIGLAHLFGFKLHQNFNAPFGAASLSEFWHRWHISLSTWLRDYLYIPLGGSRGGEWFTCRNLIITMGLGGLWHGASWTMVLWGLYHGVLLALPRIVFGGRLRALLPRPLAIAMTFFVVAIGFMVFRSTSLANSGIMLAHMVRPTSGMAPSTVHIVIALSCLGSVWLGHFLGLHGWDRTWHHRLPAPAVGAALAAFLVLVLLFVPESGKGFIYFQF
jgi:alginate O-acetyltransferase complex protein AlgI